MIPDAERIFVRRILGVIGVRLAHFTPHDVKGFFQLSSHFIDRNHLLARSYRPSVSQRTENSGHHLQRARVSVETEKGHHRPNALSALCLAVAGRDTQYEESRLRLLIRLINNRFR